MSLRRPETCLIQWLFPWLLPWLLPWLFPCLYRGQRRSETPVRGLSLRSVVSDLRVRPPEGRRLDGAAQQRSHQSLAGGRPKVRDG